MILDDLHVHLHGCLQPVDIYTKGLELAPDVARLNWFRDEFHKAYGFFPNSDAYWSQPSKEGIAAIENDYRCTQGESNFQRFQANFNLLIAVFPITPSDGEVLEIVAHRHMEEGLQCVEYRCFLPVFFYAESIATYLDTLTQTCLNLKELAGPEAHFDPYIVLSVSRDIGILSKQLEAIRLWQKNADPLELSRFVGLDFCGDEQSDLFSKEKAKFFADFHKDKIQKNPSTALALLYHAGECYDRVGVEASIQQVDLIVDYYHPHRIGHALCLIDSLLHLSPLARRRVAKAQDKVIQKIIDKKIPVESCPVSNSRLNPAFSQKSSASLLMQKGIFTVIGSDDPGIFGVELGEQLLATEQFSELNNDFSKEFSRNAREAKAYVLIGRAEV